MKRFVTKKFFIWGISTLLAVYVVAAWNGYIISPVNGDILNRGLRGTVEQVGLSTAYTDTLTEAQLLTDDAELIDDLIKELTFTPTTTMLKEPEGPFYYVLFLDEEASTPRYSFKYYPQGDIMVFYTSQGVWDYPHPLRGLMGSDILRGLFAEWESRMAKTPRALEQFYPGDMAKVDLIQIRHSGGELKTVDDKKTIGEWIGTIRRLTIAPEPDQEEHSGVLFEVSLYENGERKLVFTPTSIGNVPCYPNPELVKRMRELFEK